MRLWTLNPRMLDIKGLVALWREGLGAQKALYYYVQDKPFGYQNHSQLIRFKASPDPLEAIIAYMEAVHEEAVNRGYKFNKKLLLPASGEKVPEIPVTSGQIEYEIQWLQAKLIHRSPLDAVERLQKVSLHPLFTEVPGEVESWEKV